VALHARQRARRVPARHPGGAGAYVAEHPEHDYFETLDGNEALIRAAHGSAGGRIHVWVGLEHMFYALRRRGSALRR